MHKITLNKYSSVQAIDVECTVNVFQDSFVKTVIIWLRQMTHPDWLISGLEKVILPARVNIAQIKS